MNETTNPDAPAAACMDLLQPWPTHYMENIALVLDKERASRAGLSYEQKALASVIGLMLLSTDGVKLATAAPDDPVEHLYNFLEFTIGPLGPDSQRKARSITQVLETLKAGSIPQSWEGLRAALADHAPDAITAWFAVGKFLQTPTAPPKQLTLPLFSPST